MFICLNVSGLMVISLNMSCHSINLFLSLSLSLIIINHNFYNYNIYLKIILATIRLCADGGSNRLYDAFENSPEKRNLHLPDEIIGDLDSIRSNVRVFYEAKGVKVTQVKDQESNDFLKCIALMEEKEIALGIKDLDVVAVSAIGGRFDQTIASINTLFLMNHKSDRKFILMSDENITILLDKGVHYLQCSEYEGPTCGIMPIGAPATLTTEGLKWNLDNTLCCFGGMVSTSNVITAEYVTIKTDSPVVWTSEIRPERIEKQLYANTKSYN
ncbi:thiamine pyrophosphokinase [Phycomyces blakesleeanus]